MVSILAAWFCFQLYSVSQGALRYYLKEVAYAYGLFKQLFCHVLCSSGFFCMSVCLFCFFVCLAAFYKHSGYQNNPLLYLYIYPAHCDLIFAWRRRTCNFQYFYWSMKQMCIWIELYWIKFYLLPIGCIGRTLWHNGC